MRIPPWLVAVVVLTSGCVGSGGSSDDAKANSTQRAPEPVVDTLTGSLAGTVVDDEARPISNVQVALVEPGIIVRSDDAGAFTINDLVPGAYRVLFDRLGYETRGMIVEVVAGQVTKIQAALKPVPISREPVILALQREVFFQVDSGWAGFTTLEQTYANNSVLHGIRCDPCFSMWFFEPGAVSIQSEIHHEGTYVAPAGSDFIIMKYVRNWTDGATGSSADSSIGTTVARPAIDNDGFYRWEPEQVKAAREAHGLLKSWYFVSGLGVVVNLRVESWTVFSYNADLPDGYRILPGS